MRQLATVKGARPKKTDSRSQSRSRRQGYVTNFRRPSFSSITCWICLARHRASTSSVKAGRRPHIDFPPRRREDQPASALGQAVLSRPLANMKGHHPYSDVHVPMTRPPDAPASRSDIFGRPFLGVQCPSSCRDKGPATFRQPNLLVQEVGPGVVRDECWLTLHARMSDGTNDHISPSRGFQGPRACPLRAAVADRIPRRQDEVAVDPGHARQLMPWGGMT